MKRAASVRAAVAKSRAARRAAVERRLTGHLRYLKRHDQDGHDALVDLLRRVAVQQSRNGAVGGL